MLNDTELILFLNDVFENGYNKDISVPTEKKEYCKTIHQEIWKTAIMMHVLHH